MGILDRFFGSHLSGEERDRVIDHLTAEWRLGLRYDDHANDYRKEKEEILKRLGPLELYGTNPSSASACAEAAQQFATTVRRVLEEHGELRLIPDEAKQWHEALASSYRLGVEWADVNAESLRALTRVQLEFLSGQDRAREVEKAQMKFVRVAGKAEARLMRRVGISNKQREQIQENLKGGS